MPLICPHCLSNYTDYGYEFCPGDGFKLDDVPPSDISDYLGDPDERLPVKPPKRLPVKPPKRLPVGTLGTLTKRNRMTHSILFTWKDDEVQHIVTYGTTQENCAFAAEVANHLKGVLGWPENTKVEPTPMRKLRKRISELEQQIERIEHGTDSIS